MSLDAILACPHDDADACDCRKPKPGMLLEAAERFGLDLAASFTVGDRWRDLEAGRSAGTAVVFVDRGYAETKDDRPGRRRRRREGGKRVDHSAGTATMTEPSAISAEDLSVKVFADGADLEAIAKLAADPLIKGFTTNPTLMRKAGVTDYEAFARAALELAGERPISFEVFTDDFAEMAREARILAELGYAVYVKIPVTDTQGNSAAELVSELSNEGVKLNVTGLFTLEQVRTISGALADGAPACISLFAGRIADAGHRPRADGRARPSRRSPIDPPRS